MGEGHQRNFLCTPDGPCEICMNFEKEWKDRVIDEAVVYSGQLQIEIL